MKVPEPTTASSTSPWGATRPGPPRLTKEHTIERIIEITVAVVVALGLGIFVLTPLAMLLGGVSAMFSLGLLMGFDGLFGFTNFQVGALLGFIASILGTNNLRDTVIE